MKPDPTFDQINSAFEYSPDTGIIIWKHRPWIPKMTDIRCAGKIAGWVTSQGYVRMALFINGMQYQLLGHRVAWALMTGSWPTHEIDHRDGIPSNNKWDNLRKADRVTNNVNRKPYNKSGLKGCYYCNQTKKWKATKTINKKRYHLGTFNTAEEAHDAFCRESEKHHGEFSHHLSSK